MAACIQFQSKHDTSKTDSMTTSTSLTKHRTGPSLRRGFTLVEAMIATGISSIVMSGMMSSFVLLGKNSFNAASYSVMESESRRALESFTQDARMADNVTWNSDSSITLSIASPGGTYLVTYAYDRGFGPSHLYGYGSTIGVVLFVLTLVLTVVQLRLRRSGEEGL